MIGQPYLLKRYALQAGTDIKCAILGIEKELNTGSFSGIIKIMCRQAVDYRINVLYLT
jgi:hypothetical protein